MTTGRFAVALTCCATCIAGAVMALADGDVRPVRPGGVEGRPFWNRHSIYFLYPPAFEFAPVEGAVKYRFTVVDDVLAEHVFEAERPTADLSPVWKDIPVGYARVTVTGIGADGKVCGEAGTRRFWRQAPFVPDVPWGYGEAAKRYYDWLFDQPNTVSFREKGVPNGGHVDLLEIYPSKMDSALIRAMVHYAKMCPEKREAALRTARNVADYLLSISQPADAPLAHFPPTYWKKENQKTDFASIRYRGQVMLVYPAHVGLAYLELREATDDRKYLDAAVRIAETYAKLQLANGTWHLKLWEKDASPVLEEGCKEAFNLIPTDVCKFLYRLAKVTGDARWTAIADRAFAYIEAGPLRTYDWAAQFEDTNQTRDYVGQCSVPAFQVALLLLDRFPGDAARIAQARELADWVEDQFVFWRLPCRSDGRGILSEPSEVFSPHWGDGSKPRDDFANWIEVPSVTEKYHYNHPESGLAGSMARLYLKLYRVTHEHLYLQKARALGDGIVKVQAMFGGGNIPTHYWRSDCRGNTGTYEWINCGIDTAMSLEELAAQTEQ